MSERQHRHAVRGTFLALFVLASACGDDASGDASGGSTTQSSAAASSTGAAIGGAGGAGTGGAGAGGSGTGAGGSSSVGGGGAAACNTLPNGAPTVDVIAIDQPLPSGMGGTIEDGVYYLTDLAYYTGTGGQTGPTGTKFQSTMSVQAGTFEFVEVITDDKGTNEGRDTGTFTTQGKGGLMVAYSCPDEMMDLTMQYTASSTSLVLLFSGNGWTYSKQP